MTQPTLTKEIKNNSSSDDIIAARQLIAILQDLLAAGDWQSSGLLLRTISQKLQTYCDELKQWLEDNAKLAQTQDTLQQVVNNERTVVYISLFQTEGNNLKKWENTLKMLDHYQSRPIYRAEEEVMAMIRTKSEQQREAYVIVKIKEDAILPSAGGRPVVDRLGHELLALKRGAIDPKNIIGFVHNGNHYVFSEGELVRQEQKIVSNAQVSIAAQAA
jgi:Dot/Icm secretion system protein IcmQ